MDPARESIVSGRPKIQAIGVSHLTHDEFAVWIDDAYIVSLLVGTVSLAVLEFVVEMLDPSHPGLPSRQASWEDHPLRRRPRASIFVRAGSRPGSVPEATHRSDRSHSPGCHHARAAAAGFSPVGATKRDAHRPLRRLVRHHARPHLRNLHRQPRPLRSRRAPPQSSGRSRRLLSSRRAQLRNFDTRKSFKIPGLCRCEEDFSFVLRHYKQARQGLSQLYLAGCATAYGKQTRPCHEHRQPFGPAAGDLHAVKARATLHTATPTTRMPLATILPAIFSISSYDLPP